MQLTAIQTNKIQKKPNKNKLYKSAHSQLIHKLSELALAVMMKFSLPLDLSSQLEEKAHTLTYLAFGSNAFIWEICCISDSVEQFLL